MCGNVLVVHNYAQNKTRLQVMFRCLFEQDMSRKPGRAGAEQLAFHMAE
jgi:hypothetical protein